MKKDKPISFTKHIENATKIFNTWPKWKQDVYTLKINRLDNKIKFNHNKDELLVETIVGIPNDAFFPNIRLNLNGKEFTLDIDEAKKLKKYLKGFIDGNSFK
ncbi:MAG: hypothetical protein WC783_00035 [Candidatus Paceibacterota bacterium]|jgi:hypothetical protein